MRRFLLVGLLCAACSAKEYRCKAARECLDATGTFGLCLENYCAFRDPQCQTRYRFDDSAGPFARECVAPGQLPDASFFPVDGGPADARPAD